MERGTPITEDELTCNKVAVWAGEKYRRPHHVLRKRRPFQAPFLKSDIFRAWALGGPIFLYDLTRLRLGISGRQGIHIEPPAIQQHLGLASQSGGGARLQEAQLQGTEFFETDLQGADLIDAIGLTSSQIEEAHTDDETRLPENLTKSERI